MRPFEEEFELLNETLLEMGALVAQSRQLALVRPFGSLSPVAAQDGPRPGH